MRVKGSTEKKVLARLEQARLKDLHYEDGGILSSMCTAPHPAAKLAHEMFLEANLGDPGLFPGSAQLEKEAVASLLQLLHAPKGGVGFIVSGGTEANLLALYAARNAAKKVDAPEVVVPESAHFSFDKICDMLRLKLVKVGLDSSFRLDPSAVEERLNENTVALVVNAGSSELGTVDPISDVTKIAVNRSVPVHVDAAFGGLVLPFLNELAYPAPDFDFRLKGVQSITVDPHKMGMSTIPAGGILFRSSKVLACIKTETPYLTEPYQCTFVGTRSAASAAAAWAVFELLGREGFKKIVAHCLNLTMQLYEGLEEEGFEVLLRPPMNIVAFRNANSKVLTNKLRSRSWNVSYVPRLDCVRVVLMPHSTRQHVVDFLGCLQELQEE
jgi:tyrosine decarboxylase/aspartate 1-decarboxylase